MNDRNNYVRTASGLWQLQEAPRAVPMPAPAPQAAPAPSQRTPSRGLPQEPKERARVLAEQARAEVAREQWASAENTYRLALTFAPGDAALAEALKAVVETREKLRRAKQPR